jgi:hypothetical protein
LLSYRGPARYVGWHDPGVQLGTQDFDGAIDSGVYSALETIKTVAGIIYMIYQLITDATMTWSRFLGEILMSAAGGNGSYIGLIAQVVILLITQILDFIIDAENAPVTVGDFTLYGGKSSINPGDQRPDGSGTYGQAVGYGKVQNLSASDDYANWLIQQATALYNSNPSGYPNPALSPANAIYMQRQVASKIANKNDPLSAAALTKRGTYCVKKDPEGNPLPGKDVPWMSTVMETWPGAPWALSEIALDNMLRQWVHTMVGETNTEPKFICYAAQTNALAAATRRAVVHAGADDPTDLFSDPWVRAQYQCRVGTIGSLISSLWVEKGTDGPRYQPDFCRNRYPSITKHDGKFHYYEPDNFWATFTDKDFHCGEDEHFRQFFSLIAGFV